MQNLRENDGSPLHRKVMRFHTATCRTGGTPLHAELRAEGLVVYNDLKAKERAHEDAEDDEVDATAEVHTTEIAFENAIRDLDAALESFDRDNPGKNAQASIFPDGFGALIEPEGAKQLAVLPALHVRIEPFEQEPALAGALAKLAATETAFKDALDAQTAASEAVATAEAKELAARAAVRAQLTSAHGRLRDLYKFRPALAERFFMKLGRKEGKGGKGSGGEGGGGEGGGGAPPGG